MEDLFYCLSQLLRECCILWFPAAPAICKASSGGEDFVMLPSLWLLYSCVLLISTLGVAFRAHLVIHDTLPISGSLITFCPLLTCTPD